MKFFTDGNIEMVLCVSEVQTHKVQFLLHKQIWVSFCTSEVGLVMTIVNEKQDGATWTKLSATWQWTDVFDACCHK